jgi:hypothetical protein
MNKHDENQFEGAFENILAGNLKEAAIILEEKHKEQPENANASSMFDFLKSA